MKSLVDLLRENARLTNKELAVMLGKTPEEVAEEIEKLENEGMIIGYSAIINEEEYDRNCVTAFIELKVSPQAACGYDDIAAMIAQYREVDSVYLMSGAYDLNVVVKGKTFQEVAMFVAKELSTLEGVNSTTTHFVLRRYKELDVELMDDDKDDRGHFSF